jgi:hypothetical protein
LTARILKNSSTDHIKVEGKSDQLGENVKVVRDGNTKIAVTSSIPFSKWYLKYLTKKFLKKNSLRDWILVIASSKDSYQLPFYNIAYVLLNIVILYCLLIAHKISGAGDDEDED